MNQVTPRSPEYQKLRKRHYEFETNAHMEKGILELVKTNARRVGIAGGATSGSYIAQKVLLSLYEWIWLNPCLDRDEDASGCVDSYKSILSITGIMAIALGIFLYCQASSILMKPKKKPY